MSKYNIPKELNGFRLDKALSSLIANTSRSKIQKTITSAGVQINGIIISDSSIKVKENDHISVCFHDSLPSPMQSANIEINIVYEDKDLMVINKAAGMTVHPGAGNHQDTLANALLYYTKFLSDIGGLERPGIVHRLDKDTSGLMVVAKNNFAHVNLSRQIEKRHLSRKYKALVWGIMNPQEGIIKNNIGRSRIARQKMSILKYGGKEAITYYKTEEVFWDGLASMIECRLETGRTHQIRVQLSHANHSIIGDQTYGHNNRKQNSCPLLIQDKLRGFKRQALHSWYISFTQPVSGQFLEFSTDLPQDIIDILY